MLLFAIHTRCLQATDKVVDLHYLEQKLHRLQNELKDCVINTNFSKAHQVQQDVNSVTEALHVQLLNIVW